jgi:PAS domain S-box-containing protein
MDANKKSVKQLSIIFIAFALILSFSIMLMEELFFEQNAQKVALNNAVNKSKERESVVGSFLEHSEKNIFALRNSSFFKSYLQNKDNTNNKKQVENLFFTYADAHSSFMKIKYIDKNGKEIIKVQRDKAGEKPHLVTKDNLLDKSDRYYFSDSSSKKLEEVWFSPIELNRKNSKVETPYNPTIRAILPVKSKNGFDGVLIVSYFMKGFIDKLTNAPLYDMLLYNDKGYTLYHYAHRSGIHKKCWGNSLPHKYNISNEYPDYYKDILSRASLETETFVSRRFELPVYGGVNLILKLKEAYLLEQQKKSQEQYLTVAVMVFILSLILTYLIVKIFSGKLLNLEKLNKLNESLNSASKVAQIGFWEFDVSSNSVTWSDGVYDIFEIEDKSIPITYERFLTYLPEKDKEVLKEKFQQSISEKKEYFVTHKIITEKNNIKYVEERGKHYFDAAGNFIRSIGSIYDITFIYYSQQKFRSLLDFASDGIHILDEEGNLILYSHSFAKNLGYEYNEMENLNIYDWDSYFSKDQLLKTLKELLDTSRTFETKHKRKDGTLIDVQINAKGIELDGKRYVYSSQRDITKDKKNEREIIEKKNELESIFNTALEGIAVLDLDTRYVYFNKKYTQMLGYSEEELKTKRCMDLTAPEFKEESQQIYKKVKKDGFYENFERKCITKNGEIKVFNSSIALMPNKKQYLMTTMDFTDMKEKEKKIDEQKTRLTIQSKMSSISELLTNIAHHWRQPLSVISTAVSGLKLKSELDIISNEYISEISNEVDRNVQILSKTIEDIKMFMEGNYGYSHFELNELVKELNSLEEYSLEENGIKVVENIESDIGMYTSKDGLLQSLLNICNNSIEVLKDLDGEKYIYLDIYKAEENLLVIKIKDNGGGINEDNITKVFDPYFTTHHQSFGKGMGLNVVYNVITKTMHGDIYLRNVHFKVDNNDYKGVECKITIPIDLEK